MKLRSDDDNRSDNKQQEVDYDAIFEKITSCKVALGKVICDNEWRSKLRNAINTMTQIRVHGTLAFSDYILYTVIEREATSVTSDLTT